MINSRNGLQVRVEITEEIDKITNLWMQETQKPRKDTQYLQAQTCSPRDATHPPLLADFQQQ